MLMFRYFGCLLLITISSNSMASKANCAYELSKLKSIQHAMRTIYNSESMINEEQRRYAIYRNCKENVKSKFTKNNKKSNNKFNKPSKNQVFKNNPIASDMNSISRSNSFRNQIRNPKAAPKPRKPRPKKYEK